MVNGTVRSCQSTDRYGGMESKGLKVREKKGKGGRRRWWKGERYVAMLTLHYHASEWINHASIIQANLANQLTLGSICWSVRVMYVLRVEQGSSTQTCNQVSPVATCGIAKNTHKKKKIKEKKSKSPCGFSPETTTMKESSVKLLTGHLKPKQL